MTYPWAVNNNRVKCYPDLTKGGGGGKNLWFGQDVDRPTDRAIPICPPKLCLQRGGGGGVITPIIVILVVTFHSEIGHLEFRRLLQVTCMLFCSHDSDCGLHLYMHNICTFTLIMSNLHVPYLMSLFTGDGPRHPGSTDATPSTKIRK